MLQRVTSVWALVCVVLWCSVTIVAQQPTAAGQAPATAAQQTVAAKAEPEAPRVVLQVETTASVLRLMKFSGALRDPAGNPRSGAVGLTFALYKDQQGGSPLWLEVHNAQLDEQGRYTVLLGSTKNEGLPLELFSSGEARWLGVQLNLPGEEEQPRVLLVSVPYALKAADAETLGGKPPSAFLLADPVGADPRVRPEAGKEAVREGPPREGVVGPINGEGTVDSLAKFTGANSIGNAGIVEVSGKVGIGTASPNVKLSLGTDLTAQKLALYDGLGDFYGLGLGSGRIAFHTSNTEKMTLTSGGRLGIGTVAPNVKLSLGTDVAAQKLALYDGASDFYGLGLQSGRMVFHTANTERMTLTSGGRLGIGTTAPNVKLSLGTDVAAQKLALYDGASDFYGLGLEAGRIVFHTGNTEKMTLTAGGNVGIGTGAPGQKLTVAGTIESTSGGFKFPDSTVQTTAAGGGAATDLNCVGCVSVAELGFDPATQMELDAEASARSAADTALQSDINGRVSKAGDTMAGTLNLPFNGLVVGTNQLVTASNSNVGIGTGGPTSVLHLVGSQPPDSFTGTPATPVLQITGGKGGNATGAFFFGGTGANVNITAGAGGDSVAAAGGGGGSITLQPGAPGIGTIPANFGVVYLAADGGRVSIGTSTLPQAKLQILENSGLMWLGHVGCSAGFTGIEFSSGPIGLSCNRYSLGGNGTDTILNRSTGGGILFRENNVTQMSIAAGGAVNISGNLTVGGTLSKGAGSFKIDHPVDPANKYLSHSFVESPDMMNIYNGNVRLDRKGQAWVELPEWFEALNRDFRYQLTSIGAPGPNLYIAEEVSGNRFKIAGGRPASRVSWQVTGVRKDAYANAYRIKVEEEKPLAERGSYLHPQLFGQPKEKGLESVHLPMQMVTVEK